MNAEKILMQVFGLISKEGLKKDIQQNRDIFNDVEVQKLLLLPIAMVYLSPKFKKDLRGLTPEKVIYSMIKQRPDLKPLLETKKGVDWFLKMFNMFKKKLL